ncbi:hypothetical protein J6590_092612, partial [Homalodisca vitripennis]
LSVAFVFFCYTSESSTTPTSHSFGRSLLLRTTSPSDGPCLAPLNPLTLRYCHIIIPSASRLDSITQYHSEAAFSQYWLLSYTVESYFQSTEVQ